MRKSDIPVIKTSDIIKKGLVILSKEVDHYMSEQQDRTLDSREINLINSIIKTLINADQNDRDAVKGENLGELSEDELMKKIDEARQKIEKANDIT